MPGWSRGRHQAHEYRQPRGVRHRRAASWSRPRHPFHRPVPIRRYSPGASRCVIVSRRRRNLTHVGIRAKIVDSEVRRDENYFRRRLVTPLGRAEGGVRQLRQRDINRARTRRRPRRPAPDRWAAPPAALRSGPARSGGIRCRFRRRADPVAERSKIRPVRVNCSRYPPLVEVPEHPLGLSSGVGTHRSVPYRPPEVEAQQSGQLRVAHCPVRPVRDAVRGIEMRCEHRLAAAQLRRDPVLQLAQIRTLRVPRCSTSLRRAGT